MNYLFQFQNLSGGHLYIAGYFHCFRFQTAVVSVLKQWQKLHHTGSLACAHEDYIVFVYSSISFVLCESTKVLVAVLNLWGIHIDSTVYAIEIPEAI